MRLVQPGGSTGYGRRWVAEEPTWIGIVPVGYADGFRRDLTGTEVRVAGEPQRVVGTVSMDAFAVELDRELPVGAPVTLLGHGVMAEAHARVAETIGYEIVTGIRSAPERARRSVVDQLIPPRGTMGSMEITYTSAAPAVATARRPWRTRSGACPASRRSTPTWTRSSSSSARPR